MSRTHTQTDERKWVPWSMRVFGLVTQLRGLLVVCVSAADLCSLWWGRQLVTRVFWGKKRVLNVSGHERTTTFKNIAKGGTFFFWPKPS